ncbi:MAG: imidazole glycerol phosphate synthase subunit HisH, partial [Pseudomonadota bacterium]
MLEGTADGAAVYFVHSFMAAPDLPAHRLADCDYDGIAVAAVVRRDNVLGCQFHPEKSGEVGLAMLRRFLAPGAR